MEANRSKWFLTGMAALLLSFGLVLTSCPGGAEYEGDRGIGDIAIIIKGEAQVGQTLTATLIGGSDASAIRWERTDDVDEEGTLIRRGDVYTLTPAEEGRYVLAYIRIGSGDTEKRVYSEPVGPVEAAPVENDDDQGVNGLSIIIGGEARVKQTLTATVIGGSGVPDIRWERADNVDVNVNEEGDPIRGARGDEYTLTTAEEGRYVRAYIRIESGNNDNIVKYVYSGFVGPVAPALPPLTGPLTIDGTPRVRQVLTANTGDLDGSGIITYQWQRSDSADGGFTDITGATSFTYILLQADAGKYIRVEVRRAGYSGTRVGTVGPVELLPLTWTLIDPDELARFNPEHRAIYSAGYGGGIFLLGPDMFEDTAYSEDGADWTVTGPTNARAPVRHIVYGGGTFVAGTDLGGYDGEFVFYSTDNGQTWLEGNVNGILRRDSDSIRGMAYANANGDGTFVAVGGNIRNLGYGMARAMYSTDGGENWIETDLGLGNVMNRAVAWGGGTFVAINGNGRAAYSTDAVSWTAAPSRVLDPGNGEIGIAYDGRRGRFVAAADNGSAAYSDDKGKTWTPVNDDNLRLIEVFSDIEWGGGYFLAGGYSSSDTGKLVYSADGITWHVTGDNIPETMIAYGGERDNEGAINPNLHVVYGKGKFLVTGIGAEMYSNVVEFGD